MTEREWLRSNDPAPMLRLLEEKGAGDWLRKLQPWVEACRKRWPRWNGGTDLSSPRELRVTVGFWSSKWPGEGPHIAALLRDVVNYPLRPVALPFGPVTHVGVGGAVCVARCPWLTSAVVSLARAARDESPGRACEKCGGKGRTLISAGGPSEGHKYAICTPCGGAGLVDDGVLDPLTLSVLADALKDAGCPEEVECETCHGERDPSCPDCETGVVPHPLLQHLLSPGPHVVGCWAIDLILGKE